MPRGVKAISKGVHESSLREDRWRESPGAHYRPQPHFPLMASHHLTLGPLVPVMNQVKEGSWVKPRSKPGKQKTPKPSSYDRNGRPALTLSSTAGHM